jgi:hypothetical protein
MRIVCDCGEETDFIDGECGPSYTDGEGWYKVTDGVMELCGNHNQVFLHCQNCGKEIWIFT